MTTTEPLVSIIMPAYNAEQFIAESIESALAQTYTNWELIVVDDGSTDNTKMLVENFAVKDVRIKYLWQQNAKAGKARNLALANAQGIYTAFLDADDIWFPGKIELQLQQLQEKNADLVFSDACIFLDNANGQLSQMHSGKGFFSGEEGLKKFLEINNIPTLTVLAKTEILRKVNGFTESALIPQAEDYHLWLKLLINGYIFFGADEKLAAYRMHTSSTSAADKLAVKNVIEAFEDLKRRYKPYKSLINIYQKKWFIRYHYLINKWDKRDYKKLIEKNCAYLNKAYLVFMFRSIFFLGGINITRKLINKLVNG